MTRATLGRRPTEPLQIIDVSSGSYYAFLLVAPPHGSETFRANCGPRHVIGLADALRDIPAECQDARDFLGADPGARAAHLLAVARAGRELFRALCPTRESRDLFRRMISGREGDVIRAVTSAAAIPWEALCLAEDKDKITYADFLGWNHVVLRETHGFAPVRTGSSRGADGLVRAGQVSDDMLGSVVADRHELALGCRSGEITVDPLPALAGPTDLAPFREFFADRDNPRQVYQLDCHVERRGPVTGSHMRISSDVAVPFDEFEPDRMIILNGPFVLLNVCAGGTLSEDTRDGYAKRMREAGARAVLATEAVVGDDLAGEVAQTFYAVAGGSDLATALLKARRAILAYDHNPGVLFYGLYGDGEMNLSLDEIDRDAVQPTVRERLDASGTWWPPSGNGGDAPPSEDES